MRDHAHTTSAFCVLRAHTNMCTRTSFFIAHRNVEPVLGGPCHYTCVGSVHSRFGAAGASIGMCLADRAQVHIFVFAHPAQNTRLHTATPRTRAPHTHTTSTHTMHMQRACEFAPAHAFAIAAHPPRALMPAACARTQCARACAQLLPTFALHHRRSATAKGCQWGTRK